MVFRNRILTNVAVTSAWVFAFTIFPGYVLSLLALEAFGFWFVVSVVLFFAAWPLVFLYRTWTLPRSMTFKQDGLYLELPFGRKLEIPYAWVIGVDNSPITSYDTLFRFRTSNGHEFRVVLEQYEVDRMISLLQDYDLPRTRDSTALRGYDVLKTPDSIALPKSWNGVHYPINYGRILLPFSVFALSAAVWFSWGDYNAVVRWCAIGFSGLFGVITINKLATTCSVAFEDSGTVMVLQYLLPFRSIRRIPLYDIVEYSVKYSEPGVSLFVRITFQRQIITIWLSNLHGGERLRQQLDYSLEPCRLK